MKQTRILIDENVQYANRLITEMKQLARLATEAIAFYNRQPMLSPIELTVDAKDFLTDPVEFIDSSIWNNCGIPFTKSRPESSAVAAMFGVNYSGVVTKAKALHLTPDKLALLSFDEGSGEVILPPESETVIREHSKLWLTNPEEIAEYERLKGLCDTLNAVCDRYAVGNTERNQIERAVPFISCVPAGQGWTLKPNLNAIRTHLKTAEA